MKVRRLSDKKIHIACETNIFCNGVDGEILLETITTRFVYRKEVSTYSNGKSSVCYYANIKPGFFAGICNKYGIKKKFVGIRRLNKGMVLNVEGENVYVVFNDIIFVDEKWYTVWNREQQLKSLLG